MIGRPFIIVPLLLHFYRVSNILKTHLILRKNSHRPLPQILVEGPIILPMGRPRMLIFHLSAHQAHHDYIKIHKLDLLHCLMKTFFVCRIGGRHLGIRLCLIRLRISVRRQTEPIRLVISSKLGNGLVSLFLNDLSLHTNHKLFKPLMY